MIFRLLVVAIIAPALLYQVSILRLVYLGRFENYGVVFGMWLTTTLVSLVGPYLGLRLDLSDQLMDHYMPKVRDVISFRPGIIVVIFCSIWGYLGAISYFLMSLRPDFVMR